VLRINGFIVACSAGHAFDVAVRLYRSVTAGYLTSIELAADIRQARTTDRSKGDHGRERQTDRGKRGAEMRLGMAQQEETVRSYEADIHRRD
jgi:hypothetical protein